ncbi:hypothetical protein OG607_25715 [Streptomyces sp. NBC_01537]|uniref:hypothetical protein n=1 Tax=Streptomyces sp. NBC_01537 TaxID=2903896 RepID=UPI003863E153
MIGAWSWLEDTGFGPVAFLLLVPPRPEGEALAAELGLAEPGERLPEVGERVAVQGRDRAALHGVDFPVSKRWAAFVASGGPVAVLVGLEPLPAHAARGAVEAYVAANTLAGSLRLGISRAGSSDLQGGLPEL